MLGLIKAQQEAIKIEISTVSVKKYKVADAPELAFDRTLIGVALHLSVQHQLLGNAAGKLPLLLDVNIFDPAFRVACFLGISYHNILS